MEISSSMPGADRHPEESWKYISMQDFNIVLKV